MPIFVVILITLIGTSAWGETLEELYQAALKNTALVKESQFNTEIAKEQKSQAVATVLPTLSVNSNNVWRDQANVGAFGEPYQHTAALNLTQPLFQGGAEYYALGVAKNLPEIAKQQEEQARIDLYTQLASAYFTALKTQKERDIFLEQEKNLRERIRTLSRRAKIGRSKSTDVIAAQSQMARIQAERSKSERLFINNMKVLRNLTGLRNISVLVDTLNPQSLPFNNQWRQNLEKTPLVLANELLLINAKKEIRAAQASYLPTVDADANYYLDRAGILRDSEWDVTVVASWEIYDGGNDSSEIRIKRLQASQLEARLTDIKRNLKNDFESLKQEFFLHQKIVGQLDEAVQLAQKNYKQQMDEANRGLVSDLDALRTLEDYLQVQQTYTQQIFDTRMAWVQLRALAGEHP